jgi:hypothetical protein
MKWYIQAVLWYGNEISRQYYDIVMIYPGKIMISQWYDQAVLWYCNDISSQYYDIAMIWPGSIMKWYIQAVLWYRNDISSQYYDITMIYPGNVMKWYIQAVLWNPRCPQVMKKLWDAIFHKWSKHYTRRMPRIYHKYGSHQPLKDGELNPDVRDPECGIWVWMPVSKYNIL